MRTLIIIGTAVGVMLLFACSSNEENTPSANYDNSADSAIAVIEQADSIYKIRNGEMRGTHMHSGNAAANAHQDVGRKRRIRESEALEFEGRVDSYQNEAEQREERIRRAMEGIERDTL